MCCSPIKVHWGFRDGACIAPDYKLPVLLVADGGDNLSPQVHIADRYEYEMQFLVRQGTGLADAEIAIQAVLYSRALRFVL